jgi:hypothetical protein
MFPVRIFFYCWIGFTVVFTVGAMVGIMEASKMSVDAGHCDQAVHATYLGIQNGKMVLALPGDWRGTDGNAYLPILNNHTFVFGERVDIYRSCSVECYSGGDTFYVNVFHWDPPKATRDCTMGIVLWFVFAILVLILTQCLVIVSLECMCRYSEKKEKEMILEQPHPEHTEKFILRKHVQKHYDEEHNNPNIPSV